MFGPINYDPIVMTDDKAIPKPMITAQIPKPPIAANRLCTLKGFAAGERSSGGDGSPRLAGAMLGDGGVVLSPIPLRNILVINPIHYIKFIPHRPRQLHVQWVDLVVQFIEDCLYIIFFELLIVKSY